VKGGISSCKVQMDGQYCHRRCHFTSETPHSLMKSQRLWQ